MAKIEPLGSLDAADSLELMRQVRARAMGRRPSKVDHREKPKNKISIIALACLHEAQGEWRCAVELEAIARRQVRLAGLSAEICAMTIN